MADTRCNCCLELSLNRSEKCLKDGLPSSFETLEFFHQAEHTGLQYEECLKQVLSVKALVRLKTFGCFICTVFFY